MEAIHHLVDNVLPQLHRLTFDHYVEQPKRIEVELIPFWTLSERRELKITSAIALTGAMLKSLASLPMLSSLHLRLEPPMKDIPVNGAAPAFPSLRSLKLIASLEDVVTFLAFTSPIPHISSTIPLFLQRAFVRFTVSQNPICGSLARFARLFLPRKPKVMGSLSSVPHDPSPLPLHPHTTGECLFSSLLITSRHHTRTLTTEQSRPAQQQASSASLPASSLPLSILTSPHTPLTSSPSIRPLPKP